MKNEIIENEKVIRFKNDDEFEIFANGGLDIKQSERGYYYSSLKFSDAYKTCLDDGFIFVMEDPKSLILKRGKMTYKTHSIPVENLVSVKEYERNRRNRV